MKQIIILRNTTLVDGTWKGVSIMAGAYYTLTQSDIPKFANDSKVFDSVANGDLLVNDGLNDLLPMPAWDWISGNKQDVNILQTSEIGNKKLWVHSSAKPEMEGQRFYSQWIGFGDNITTGEIAGGQQCILSTEVGTPKTIIDIELDNTRQDIYLHEGYAMWKNASIGDNFSAKIVAKASVFQGAANLDLEMDTENRVKYAVGGAGTGTIGFGGTPVLVPTILVNNGFWNYDETNGLVPAPNQDGAYNIYDIEITVQAFVHKVPILGSSNMFNRFVSSDVSKLPVGYFIRIEANNVSDTVWDLSIMFQSYREKTINTIHDGI